MTLRWLVALATWLSALLPGAWLRRADGPDEPCCQVLQALAQGDLLLARRALDRCARPEAGPTPVPGLWRAEVLGAWGEFAAAVVELRRSADLETPAPWERLRLLERAAGWAVRGADRLTAAALLAQAHAAAPPDQRARLCVQQWRLTQADARASRPDSRSSMRPALSSLLAPYYGQCGRAESLLVLARLALERGPAHARGLCLADIDEALQCCADAAVDPRLVDDALDQPALLHGVLLGAVLASMRGRDELAHDIEERVAALATAEVRQELECLRAERRAQAAACGELPSGSPGSGSSAPPRRR